jgi:hypothetical protein
MAENKGKRAPAFNSLEEEREFWDSHDATEYFDFEHDVIITGGPKSAVLNIRIEPQVKAQLEHYARLEGLELADLVREWIYAGIEQEIVRHYPGSTIAIDDRDAELLILVRLMESVLEKSAGESADPATARLKADGLSVINSDQERYDPLYGRAARFDTGRILDDMSRALQRLDFRSAGVQRRARKVPKRT